MTDTAIIQIHPAQAAYLNFYTAFSSEMISDKYDDEECDKLTNLEMAAEFYNRAASILPAPIYRRPTSDASKDSDAMDIPSQVGSTTTNSTPRKSTERTISPSTEPESIENAFAKDNSPRPDALFAKWGSAQGKSLETQYRAGDHRSPISYHLSLQRLNHHLVSLKPSLRRHAESAAQMAEDVRFGKTSWLKRERQKTVADDETKTTSNFARLSKERKRFSAGRRSEDVNRMPATLEMDET